MEDKGKAGARGKDIWKLALFAAVVLSLIVLARLFGLGERLQELREWIAGMGNRGMVVFVALYIVAVVAAVPGLPISIAAAAIFGAPKGVILVSIGSTLGASTAFLISRYLARDAINHWLSGNEKFQRLDRLTEKHGAIIVAITRLVPLFPFNILNYGYGLTRVPFWTFAFWSWLCMLPGTIVYLVGTDAIVSAATTGEVPWLIVGVFVVALAGVILAVRVAGGKLKEKEKSAEQTDKAK
ncbi:MAG TPA: TVP38/TMEM64 family protein [Syntrophales bacterium]